MKLTEDLVTRHFAKGGAAIAIFHDTPEDAGSSLPLLGLNRLPIAFPQSIHSLLHCCPLQTCSELHSVLARGNARTMGYEQVLLPPKRDKKQPAETQAHTAEVCQTQYAPSTGSGDRAGGAPPRGHFKALCPPLPQPWPPWSAALAHGGQVIASSWRTGVGNTDILANTPSFAPSGTGVMEC